jgi:hypothetical protein
VILFVYGISLERRILDKILFAVDTSEILNKQYSLLPFLQVSTILT